MGGFAFAFGFRVRFDFVFILGLPSFALCTLMGGLIVVTLFRLLVPLCF